MRKDILTVTDRAAAQIQKELAKYDKPAIGLRIGVKINAGCSGKEYTIGYAEEKLPFEEVVETKGVIILIEPTAVMFLIESEMDYVEDKDKYKAEFTFNNPNVTGHCGCGKSFST